MNKTMIEITYDPNNIGNCPLFFTLPKDIRIILLLDALLQDFDCDHHTISISIKKQDKFLMDILVLEYPEYIKYQDINHRISSWILSNGKKIPYTPELPMVPMAYETSSGDRYYY